MLFDHQGRAFHEGTTIKELNFDVFTDTALPSWLSIIGTDAVASFSSAATTRGFCTLATKIATPAIDDFAGIAPAFDFDTSMFTEIGFFVSCVVADVDATQTNSGTQIYIGNKTSTGALAHNTGSSDQHQGRVFGSAAKTVRWGFGSTLNAPKRKNIGMVIRPRTQEVAFTSGDPKDGDAAFFYDIGNWTDLTARPVLGILARTAARRSFSFSKVTLRLAHY